MSDYLLYRDAGVWGYVPRQTRRARVLMYRRKTEQVLVRPDGYNLNRWIPTRDIVSYLWQTKTAKAAV